MDIIGRRKYITFLCIILLLTFFVVAYNNHQENQNLTSGWYPSGTYIVGKDIPPGKYYAKSDPEIQGFYKINSIKSCYECHIKKWDTFDKSVYFTVEDGDSLTIDYANFIQTKKLKDI